MRHFARFLAVASVLIVSSACYHVTVETGLTPNGTTITNKWAHAFVGGLIPPATVQTAQKCPGGVAKIESQLSFLNMLVGGLTYSLYTPMQIVVSCAGGGGGRGGDEASLDAQGLEGEALVTVFNDALTQSKESGSAVMVRMR